MTSIQRKVLWSWVGTMGVASLVVLLVAGQQAEEVVRAGGIALGSWFPAVMTLLGTLIAIRQPENRIAWLLIGIGFAVLVEVSLQLFLSGEPSTPTSLDLAAMVLVHVALPAALYLSFLIPFMFPSGQFFTRRQALAAWPGAIMLATLALIALFTEEIGLPFPAEDQEWTVTNPFGFLSPSVLEAAIALALGVIVATAVGGVLSLVSRYRRSSAVTRAQIRWMLFSTFIVGAVLVLIVATDASQNAVGGLLLVLAFISMPLSITVAITRYRLFEIDRIISRTLTYAVVVSLLAGVFVGLVVVVGSFLPSNNPLVVAGATLAVAALFNPLRRRIQHVVDRRFNRSAYQAELVAEEFAAKLRESLSSQEIINLWTQTVEQEIQPEAVGIWLKAT